MSNKVTFTAPKEYTVPEGITEGDTFDVAATMKLESGGKLCLVKVDDIPMPGYEEEADKGRKAQGSEEAGESADLASRYQSAMAQAGGMPQQ